MAAVGEPRTLGVMKQTPLLEFESSAFAVIGGRRCRDFHTLSITESPVTKSSFRLCTPLDSVLTGGPLL
jgi:hypothetical protein